MDGIENILSSIRVRESANEKRYVLAEEDVKTIQQYLIDNKEIRAEELKELFPALYSTLVNADSVDRARVVCSDTMSIWMLRGTKVARIQQEDELRNVLDEERSTAIFEYMIDFLESGTGPLVNSLVSLLNKIIMFSKVLNAECKEMFHRWVDLTMKLPYTSKNLYFLVEILSKEVDSHYVFTEHAKFAERCISIMWSNPLSNAASKAFASIYQRVYVKGEDQQWLEKWQELVTNGLKDEGLSRNIQVYLLPSLFRVSPKSYDIFITKYSVHKLNELTNTDIDMYLGLLKVGQDLALFPDIFKKSGNVVPIDFISSCLTHEEPKFRISSFALLVGSAKGSQPIQKEVYDVLVEQNILQMFYLDCDSVEFRNDFASLLRQFLIRLRDSVYSLSRDLEKLRKKNYDVLKQNDLQQLISNGHDFLVWFLNFLKKNFMPGSSYAQLSLSMKLFQILVDLNLDNVTRNHAYDRLSNKTKVKISNNKMVFPFSIVIFDKKLLRLAVDNITNSYEDLRDASVNLLLDCPQPIISEAILNKDQEIIEKALIIITELKGKKSEGGAKVIQFLSQIYSHFGEEQKLEGLISTLIDKLDTGLNLEYNGDQLSREQRVHGIFTSLKLILQNLNHKTIHSNTLYWSKLFSHIIDQISNIWTQMKPLVSNTAVENEDNELINDKLILNYSWKVIKESTSLLSTILEVSQIEKGLLLDKATFLLSAEIIMDQLASVKHRGAFSSVYPSFVSACEICFTSKDEELQGKPEQWLKKNIKLIKSKAQYISRRSGGLPYLITAILTAEKSSNSDLQTDIVGFTFRELISITKEAYVQNADEKMDIPQVHAFNCLKHIFIDSNLSSLCGPYVNQILTLTLLNFYNDTWAIRNCAVMLFTAVQNRLFGTSKLGELQTCLSSRLFFAKYNGIEHILFQNLVDASSADHSMKFNVIFPVLTILSRLENTSTMDPKLQKFESILIKCLHHKYWKVREMAARALAAILFPSNLIPTIEYLLNDSCKATMNYNLIHGNLLSILEIIKRIENKLPDYKLSVNDITNIVQRIDSILLDKNVFSWATAKCFVNIVKYITDNEDGYLLGDDILNIMGNFVVLNLTTDIFDNRLNGARQLLLVTMIELLCSQYLKMKKFEEIVDLIRLCLISKEVYEVQLVAIRFCESRFDQIDDPENVGYTTSILEGLWEIVSDNSCWSFVRSNALDLMGKFRWEEIKADNLLSKIETLFLFTLSEYNEDSNSKALEALGPLVGQTAEGNINDTTHLQRFITLANSFANEDRPTVVRLSSVSAIISYVNMSAKKGIQGLYVAKAVFMLYNALSDDEKDIRVKSAKCLSNYFAFEYNKVPISVAFDFGREFLKKFGNAEPIIVENFMSSKPLLREKLSELDKQTEDSLFDVESTNLYRNDIQVREEAVLMLKTCNEISLLYDTSVLKITEKVKSDIEYIIDFVSRHGYDGYIGWCKDEFVYTSILEGLLNLQFVIKLRDNLELMSKADTIRELLDRFEINYMVRDVSDFFVHS